MPHFRAVLRGDSYAQWLAQVAAGPRIRPGAPLDPFSTSLRTVDQAAMDLFDLIARRPLNGDMVQKTRDLRWMRLTDDGRAPTALGEATFEAWQDHGAGDPALAPAENRLERSSVLRCVLLIREAQKLGEVRYAEYVERWRKLRTLYDANVLVESTWLLYAYSYFDQTIDGYNPWHSLGGLPREAFAMPDDALTDSERSLYRRINDLATRGTGRQQFCSALECYTSPTAAAREAFLRQLA
ncbi:MAG TPA: hypothetical protein VHT92_05230 [Candidatus Cybelea sp.]|jgi:hypothetical protein|nr:hypothetical protein [Candidatus Cybelea sp.]